MQLVGNRDGDTGKQKLLAKHTKEKDHPDHPGTLNF